MRNFKSLGGRRSNQNTMDIDWTEDWGEIEESNEVSFDNLKVENNTRVVGGVDASAIKGNKYTCLYARYNFFYRVLSKEEK